MGKYCCGLAESIEEERMLFRTDNFFVIPTLGPMNIEGYLLVVPNDHYHAIAEISRDKMYELDQLIRDVKGLLAHEYGLSSLVFEHGPRLVNLDSGKSIDHAHLHIVPGVDITTDWAGRSDVSDD